MVNFKQRLNSVLVELDMISKFLQRLDYDTEFIDSKYENQLLTECFDILYQQAINLLSDCENYGLIKQLDWDESSKTPVFAFLEDSLTDDITSIQLNNKSSLDPILGALATNAKSIKLLYEFEDHKKFPLIYDNLFQLDDCVKYMILLLVNCSYCTKEFQSSIINLNIHPEIKFDDTIFTEDN